MEIVLQVHDEIVFRMRKDAFKEYDEEIIKRMTTFPEFNVRFKTEAKVWNQ